MTSSHGATTIFEVYNFHKIRGAAFCHGASNQNRNRRRTTDIYQLLFLQSNRIMGEARGDKREYHLEANHRLFQIADEPSILLRAINFLSVILINGFLIVYDIHALCAHDLMPVITELISYNAALRST